MHPETDSFEARSENGITMGAWGCIVDKALLGVSENTCDFEDGYTLWWRADIQPSNIQFKAIIPAIAARNI